MRNENHLTVIIVTYNSEKFILECIQSVKNHTFDFELDFIIIDNNSTDNTLRKLEEINFDYKFIQNEKNLGYATACNQGIKLSCSPYIFILNPDTKFLNNALDIFYEFMKMPEHSNVWCCGGLLFNEHQEIRNIYRFPKIKDVLLEQFGFYRLQNDLKKTMDYINTENIIVEYVPGAAMFIRKKSLDEIGLFNESFFLNYEETELAFRAKTKEYKSVICTDAKILHYGSKSFKSNKEYLEHLWEGQVLFFKLSQNRTKTFIVKLLHVFGVILRTIKHFEITRLKRIKKIVTI